MNNQPQLGRLLDENDNAERDAVHVAIFPAIAGEELEPGDVVTVENGVAYRYRGDTANGIVDPFLTSTVSPSQKFYVCLNPGSITGMRHHWFHPAIDEESPIKASQPRSETVEEHLNRGIFIIRNEMQRREIPADDLTDAEVIEWYQDDARDWLVNKAVEFGWDFDTLIMFAKEYWSNREWYVGSYEEYDMHKHYPEIREYLSRIGIDVPPLDDPETYFRCAC
jgi:hypothetical protein